ncbi:MAG: cobalamin B12-binding domain-containing protein, partial [Opitutae bacterium]|nr:cobalamin B12-binding domain-containing protein [Opitutae bacterium]
MNVPIKEKPTTAELIERGFDPQNGRIDILFIYPSDSTAERYGRKDMGNVEGNLIPLGIASIAGYLREKGWGVGVLDCPALRINAEDVYEIIEERDPEILAFSTTTYSLSKALELAKYIR